MLKIKDYIFNENEIKRIEPYEQKVSLISERDIKGIKVVQKDINTIVDNVTVDDIEWNYGATQDKIKELKEDYITLEKDYGTCELENSKLRTEIIEQKDRINKAKEYIGNGNLGIPRKTREKFIKILKGE